MMRGLSLTCSIRDATDKSKPWLSPGRDKKFFDQNKQTPDQYVTSSHICLRQSMDFTHLKA